MLAGKQTSELDSKEQAELTWRCVHGSCALAVTVQGEQCSRGGVKVGVLSVLPTSGDVLEITACTAQLHKSLPYGSNTDYQIQPHITGWRAKKNA
jgi:hypothetical protein